MYIAKNITLIPEIIRNIMYIYKHNKKTMVLCDFHGFPWVSMGVHGFPWGAFSQVGNLYHGTQLCA